MLSMKHYEWTAESIYLKTLWVNSRITLSQNTMNEQQNQSISKHYEWTAYSIYLTHYKWTAESMLSMKHYEWTAESMLSMKHYEWTAESIYLKTLWMNSRFTISQNTMNEQQNQSISKHYEWTAESMLSMKHYEWTAEFNAFHGSGWLTHTYLTKGRSDVNTSNDVCPIVSYQ